MLLTVAVLSLLGHAASGGSSEHHRSVYTARAGALDQSRLGLAAAHANFSCLDTCDTQYIDIIM